MFLKNILLPSKKTPALVFSQKRDNRWHAVYSEVTETDRAQIGLLGWLRLLKIIPTAEVDRSGVTELWANEVKLASLGLHKERGSELVWHVKLD